MSSTAYIQEGAVCARPECNNPLNKGKFYCSNQCVALDRARVKALNASRSKLSSDAMEFIPADAQKQFLSITGDDGVAVLDEIALAIRENAPIVAPPLRAGLTVSGDDIYRYGVLKMDGNKSYRASDALSYGTIGDMMKNGQVIFSLALKQSAISGVLSKDRSWKVICQNERMAEVVRGIMSRVFRRSTHEMMEYIPYGAAFFEKEWDYRSAAYWGIEESIRGKFYGYEDLKSIHPQSIDHIRYLKKGKEFNGFVQKPPGRAKDIPVPRELSFILTYDQKWRNLWGSPATDAMYPYWFWLEVAWRSFMRYLERTGNPVVVVYAPSKGKVLGPDSVSYPSMQYALLQAAYVVKSNAAAFPSDTDPDSGNKLWEIEYLNDQQKGDQFLGAIDKLSLMLNRSVVIGDTAATQQGDTGSFAMSRSHLAVTQMHSSMVLSEALQQINDYLVDPVVRYNGSVQSPPARIEAVTLDPEHKDRLFKLLSIMGNQQESSPMRQVDWVRVMSDSEIPALTEEEIDDEFDKELERSKVKQEQAAEIQNKMAAPQEKKLSPGQKRPVLNSMEWQMCQIAEGAHMPVLISDKQRQELEDRLSPRPKIFDMHINLDDNIDFDVDKIVEETMAETDTSEMSPEEIEKLRDYILGLLGVKKKGGERSLEYAEADAIELGKFGDALRKAFAAAKKFVNRVVKKVTGKNIGEWRKAVFGSGEGKKYTSKVGAVIVTRQDGTTYVWNPEDHPRGPGGKFAEKGNGEGESKKPTKPHAVTKGKIEEGHVPERKPEQEREFGNVQDPFPAHDFEAAQKILKESHGLDIKHYGNFSEAHAARAANMMITLLDDPDFKDTEIENVVFADSVDAIKDLIADKPFLGLQALLLNNQSSAFYIPNAKSIIFFSGSTTAEKGRDMWFEETAIHETFHSIGGRGAWTKLGHAMNTEEPTTELLAQRKAYSQYGIKAAFSYPRQIDSLEIVLKDRNKGDMDAIWKDVEYLHANPGVSASIKFIKDTYPSLTTAQLAAIGTKLAFPMRKGDQGAWEHAMLLHYNNTGGSPYSARGITDDEWLGLRRSLRDRK